MNKGEMQNVLSTQNMRNVSVVIMSSVQSSPREAINWLRYVDKLVRLKGDKRIECELDLIIGILKGNLE
jgi:hypothetical protein|tara:strand:+ start:518 stop:724 length:207 start_codon:yes stop_codon:yes gene_type:complete